MAIDTVPDGCPTISIPVATQGDQLYEFLEQAFDAKLLDRHDTRAVRRPT
jgi:hypothetical protein